MVGREVQLTVDRGESHPGERPSRSRTCGQATTAATRPSRASTSTSRAGEILGIAGVAGNGQDELVEAITGCAARPAGTRLACGTRCHRRDRAAREHGISVSFRATGIGTVSSWRSRRRQPRPHATTGRPFAAGLWRNDNAIEEWAAKASRTIDIRTPSGTGTGGTLSGGNQQKTVVAREFSRDLARARARPADARPRRRQHRVHPPPGHREARRGYGDPARVGRARRGHGAVRPGRRDVPRRDRSGRRRADGGPGEIGLLMAGGRQSIPPVTSAGTTDGTSTPTDRPTPSRTTPRGPPDEDAAPLLVPRS